MIVCFLRERLEAEQEKVVRQLPLHNHSRDSAIDNDLQEWEIETLHIPVVSIILSYNYYVITVADMKT